MEKQEFSLIYILRVLNKWKKNIAIFTVLATIATAIFSWFFMDDYYLSYARYYPINLAYTDRAYMFSETGADIPFYGDKDDANRVLEIAKSAELAQYIINKYDLATHYEVDTTKKFWRTKVIKKYDSRYKAMKTEQGAIEISILDTDPKLAKDIMDDYLVKIDEINRGGNNYAKQIQLDLFEKQVNELEKRADVYADTLGVLGAKYKVQVKAVAGHQVVEGQDYVGTQLFKIILEKQKSTLELLNNMSEIKEQLKASLAANTMSLSITDRPFIADRKEKPVRSIIVISAFLLSLFAGAVGALLIEEINEIRKQI